MTDPSSKERLQMLYWLKTGQSTSRRSLAERLGRDEATITRWLKKYKDGGYRGLLEVKQAPGKEPIVTGEHLERLKERLSQPQGFHSYSQIQQWLAGELKLNIAYKTVYQLVVCQELIDGYSRFNLIRASSVVNCQSVLEEI